MNEQTPDWSAFFEGLAPRVGAVLSTSDWFTLDQRTTDIFAALIGNLDPVHNDPGWAAESPWGGTIAIGNQGLAMVPAFLLRCGFPVAERDVRFAPAGLERVRFVAPLGTTQRARETTTLVALERETGGAWRAVTDHVIDREDEERPFMAARFTARYVPEAAR